MKTSTASQGDGGSPGTAGVTRLSAGACRHDLWLTAAEAIGALEFGPVARRFLQAWIRPGLTRKNARYVLPPSSGQRRTSARRRPTILSRLMSV
jgi:hypothetical protein